MALTFAVVRGVEVVAAEPVGRPPAGARTRLALTFAVVRGVEVVEGKLAGRTPAGARASEVLAVLVVVRGGVPVGVCDRGVADLATVLAPAGARAREVPRVPTVERGGWLVVRGWPEVGCRGTAALDAVRLLAVEPTTGRACWTVR